MLPLHHRVFTGVSEASRVCAAPDDSGCLPPSNVAQLSLPPSRMPRPLQWVARWQILLRASERARRTGTSRFGCIRAADGAERSAASSTTSVATSKRQSTNGCAVKDDLLAGRLRPPKGGGLTVRDLCNRFLTVKRHPLDTRELPPRTWQSYYQSCAKLVAALGKSRLVEGLTAADFEALRATLAEGRGPVTLRGDVLTIRMVFSTDTTMGRSPTRFVTA